MTRVREMPSLCQRASHTVGHPSRSADATQRRGAAAVEFAVCLPILIVLVFGSIEASSMIFLKQSLNVAAFEATRQAIRPNGSNAEALNRATAILDSRGVQGYAVDFPNGDASTMERGDEFAAVITAPTAANSPTLGEFLANRNLRVRVVMLKQ
ncbi:MAG: TadE family protein [Planctomycetota bacterium]